MHAASPFHRGEQALQSRAGVRDRIESFGATFIREAMPAQHRELFARLPTLLLGALDADGQPWATMLHGAPGFVSTPDERTLRVAALPAAEDPVAPLLHEGAAVGALGLEPQTRRRNRANGMLVGVGSGLAIRVQQSFGNCPKYIHARSPLPRPDRVPGAARHEGGRLGDAALALVRRADTLFIASASSRVPSPHPRGGEGVDVSHRGGRPGFVRVEAAAGGHRLTLPDYAGNSLYNTLGNLLVWPIAGLLFVDHDSGDVLQLAVRAELQHDGPELAAHPGAQRLLHLRVVRGRWRPAALPLAWTTPEPAPQFGG